MSREKLEVNVPLLRKAVEWAEAEAVKPKVDCQWNQLSWINNARDIGRECGTCYCIGGYVAQLTDERYATDAFVDGVHSSQFAAKTLGLSFTQEDDLFKASNSIERVREVAERIAGGRL